MAFSTSTMRPSQNIGRITKSGNPNIRQLLVIGTRSVMRICEKKNDQVSIWVKKKKEAKGFKRTDIALANKTARIIFGVLKKQKKYEVKIAA